MDALHVLEFSGQFVDLVDLRNGFPFHAGQVRPLTRNVCVFTRIVSNDTISDMPCKWMSG